MKTARYIILSALFVLTLPLCAESKWGGQILHYADEYAKCKNAQSRLKLANDFFAFLRQIDYIDEPIAFPATSHIDSVDVNVYYYVAEWCYGEGDYQSAINYCTRATQCFGIVDDESKSDVYALLGAVYLLPNVTFGANTLWGIDKFLLGTIVGTVCFWVGARWYLNIKRNHGGHAMFPFQKVVMPISLLLVATVIFWFITK